jgi:Rad3-related DNA helicase
MKFDAQIDLDKERLSSRSIFEFVPDDIQLRAEQKQILKWVEDNWNTKRVFIIEAPTATGKSIVAMTIASYSTYKGLSSATIVPTKILQNQYAEDFPQIPMLKGAANYECDTATNCQTYKGFTNKFCPGCPYVAARVRAEQSPRAIYNLHSYYFSGEKGTLIIDEGHNVKDFLVGLMTVKIGQVTDEYPENQKLDNDSIIALLASKIKKLTEEVKQLDPSWDQSRANDCEESEDKINLTLSQEEMKALQDLKETILKYEGVLNFIRESGDDRIIVEQEEYYYKQKQKVITISPRKLDRLGKKLWDDSVKKVFILSATINSVDQKALGFPEAQTACIQVNSPIPADNRKVVVIPVASMAYKAREESFPVMCEAIRKIVALKKEEKGVIHTTYDMAEKLRKVLVGSRFIFHDKYDKEKQYRYFLNSPAGSVLIASGMEEGIDLAHDRARWQIVTQVMFPFLGDPRWKWIVNNAPEEYYWEAVRTIIQQSGRVCRSPDDRGITYILDSQFWSLYEKASKMWPKWYIDSIKRFDPKKL